MKGADISPVFVHAPYLPNLAAAQAADARRSVAALVEQAARCAALGVNYLVAHVGKALGAPEKKALAQVAKNVDAVLAKSPRSVTLLLENTAGMGSEVGHSFAQMGAIIAAVGAKDRVGVVLDTAHAFEAGYDVRTRAGLDSALREFDKLVGLGRLHLLHLNDSKTVFGSHVDRHWHIGQGEIGLDGFRLIVNHPLLKHLPAVMETPRDGVADDRRNLKVVERLVA